jgi:endonuclease/exonuclease/phosphatase family metal-dependent hydrolase
MKRPLFLLFLGLPILWAHCGGAGIASFKVATLNMYVGFDIGPILDGSVDLSDPAVVQEAIDAFFADFQNSEPSARIAAMAAAIAEERPHLIGLQEVLFLSIGGTTASDFLGELIEAIRDAGGPDYQSLALTTFSVTLQLTLEGTPTTLLFSDREAILYRNDVSCASLGGGLVFEATRDPVTVLDQEVSLTRGILGALCELPSGQSVHFFSTHLDQETFPTVQEAQTAELLAEIEAQAADPALPVILVGDFNSLESGATTASYGRVLDDGFLDAFREIHSDASATPGFTCCQESDLSNAISEAGQRIDYLFFKSGGLTAVGVDLFADETIPREDGSGTLWPSDHFGVIATFQ